MNLPSFSPLDIQELAAASLAWHSSQTIEIDFKDLIDIAWIIPRKSCSWLCPWKFDVIICQHYDSVLRSDKKMSIPFKHQTAQFPGTSFRDEDLHLEKILNHHLFLISEYWANHSLMTSAWKLFLVSCFLTYVDLEIFIWQLDVLVLEHWNGPNDGIPLNPSLTSDSSSPLIIWPGICHPRMKQQKTFIYQEELNRNSQSRINSTPDLLVLNLFYTIFSPRTIKAVTFPQIAEIKSDSILQFISPQTWLSEPKSIKETCSIISCLLGYLLNWGMLASSSHSCLN